MCGTRSSMAGCVVPVALWEDVWYPELYQTLEIEELLSKGRSIKVGAKDAIIFNCTM